MRRSKFPFRSRRENGKFLSLTPRGQTAILIAACILLVLIPFLLMDQLNTSTLLNIPTGFFLITQICPILLCILVYLYSRKQAVNDLQLDDET
ncbi:MAG: DUF4212 domain-containing protein [Rhizobiaceae bacterium]|nr:DUF4212 domain-containing protein [Rhizobiaceae bacterium]MBL4697074.1 DUF4212 domain-containing protein [Rhizobiaceae bacterium]